MAQARHAPVGAADPHGQVDALFRQVHETVGERDARLQPWMAARELQQQGQDLALAEGGGQVHAQAARRLLPLRGQRRLGFLQLVQHPHAGPMKGRARVRQRQPPGAALEQPRAHPILQPRHALPTADALRLRRSAAAVKLPASATQTKTSMPFRRSDGIIPGAPGVVLTPIQELNSKSKEYIPWIGFSFFNIVQGWIHATHLPHATPDFPATPATASGPAIIILALAAFVIVSTEFLIVGLIPALARDFGVSVPQAGQLVALFAFTVMLAGPPLTAALAHVERKRLFVAILLVFAGANALAALAPNLWVLALARFIPALALPVFWGTASEAAARMAGPLRAGQAVSRVYLGISAALLFGIPIGTLAAAGLARQLLGLAALSLLLAALMARHMPALSQSARTPLRDQARILKDPLLLAHIGLSVAVFTAMFTAYTYLADILERLAGVAPAQVGWWLMGFGAVGLIGNALGGKAVDRHPLRATLAFTLLLGLGTLASMPLAASLGGLLPALAAWSIANTALYPICQVRVMQAAPQAQALAGTLNVSAANAGIALGAALGGLAIPRWGLDSVGYAAAAVALLAALMIAPIARLRPARPA